MKAALAEGWVVVYSGDMRVGGSSEDDRVGGQKASHRSRDAAGRTAQK